MISQRPDESHDDYPERCATIPIALESKIADVKDNLGRIDFVDESSRKRLAEKYKRSIEFLAARKASLRPPERAT